MKKKIFLTLILVGIFLTMANFSWAADPFFANPIGPQGMTLTMFVDRVLSNLAGVIASIAVVFVVIGGIMYMMSAGDEKKIETAKNILTSAMIGLAITLATPTFLRTIINIFGGGSLNPFAVNSAPDIKVIIGKVLQFLLSVVGGLAIIGLVSGGIMYMTSYGDEDRMEKGKKILIASIIGIVICLGALIIVKQIGSFFGIN